MDAPTESAAVPVPRLPGPLLLLVAGALALPWLVVFPLLLGARSVEDVRAWLRPAASPLPLPMDSPVFRLPPGPWGEIEARRIEIAVPEEFIGTILPADYRPEWVFTGFTAERLALFFRSLPLSEQQQRDILRPSAWRKEPTTVRVYPKADTVLSLSPEARARIYGQLLHSWDPQSQRFAMPYRPGELERRLTEEGVAPAVQEMVKGLRYPRGEWVMFGDVPLVVSRISDIEERRRFLHALSRQPTYVLQLRLMPLTDLDRLAAYWDAGGMGRELRPLLESVARVSGGGTIDLVHLLPTLARRQLYTFPISSFSTLEDRRDCHWTAMNFFNEQPDDRYTDPRLVGEELAGDFDVVSDPPRFGDIIGLHTMDERLIHSAVYIAGDMLFSKNGADVTIPWLFQPSADMVRYYNAMYSADGGVRLRVYRRRATVHGVEGGR